MSSPKQPLRNKTHFDVNYYFKGIRNKDLSILSKAITLLESTKLEHHEIAENLIELCIPLSGKSLRIGVTGVPGVGKSTFIDSFGQYLIETQNKQIAVLAIDPSSTKNKGSILGDKTRMNFLSTNQNAFVRPSPSSGTLGGVTKATRESIILCEAYGFDTIVVETVGVGQSEIEVNSMVDFFLLLMLSGAGDELQGIKRGIMEMADAMVITKTDIEDKDRVNLAKQHYTNALHLFPANENGWIPLIESCSAVDKTNIGKIWDIIAQHKKQTTVNGWFEKKRKHQAIYWLGETINNSLLNLFYTHDSIKNFLPKLEINVVEGKISPFKAAKILLERYKKK